MIAFKINTYKFHTFGSKIDRFIYKMIDFLQIHFE